MVLVLHLVSWWENQIKTFPSYFPHSILKLHRPKKICPSIGRMVKKRYGHASDYQQRPQLSKFIFNVTSFTMFTNHIMDVFTSARWLNYLHWALDVSFELAPLKHVAHLGQARLWHACDFLVFYDVIPNVDTCHFPDKRLVGIKFSPLWVLILP